MEQGRKHRLSRVPEGKRGSARFSPGLYVRIGLAVLALTIYGGSLTNGFVFDDRQIIEENRAVKDWPDDHGIYTSNYWFEQPGTSLERPNNYYRPAVLQSFAIDYKLWGRNAAGFHLTNLLLFVLLLFALYSLFAEILGSVQLAAAAAAFFAVNPIHNEVVSFIGGRTDLLAALFSAGMLWQYWIWRQRRRKRHLVFSLTCWFLALGSKEAAFSVPLLLLGLEIVFREGRPVLWRREYWWFGTIAALYLTARYLVLKGNTPWQGDSFDLTAIGTYPEKAWRYLRLTVLPSSLSTYYTEHFTARQPWVVGGCLLGLLPAIIPFLPRIREHREPLIAAQIFLWSLIPAIGLISNTSNVEFAERFCFFASAGVALFLAWSLKTILCALKSRTAAIIAGLAVAAYAGWMGHSTYVRNGIWRSDLTLFRDMARTSPGSFLAHYNLANELAKRQQADSAVVHYRMAIALDSASIDARTNLGTLFFMMEEWLKAEDEYRKAVRLNPGAPFVYFNLGLTLHRQGKHQEAAQWFERSLEKDPGFLPARKALGLP